MSDTASKAVTDMRTELEAIPDAVQRLLDISDAAASKAAAAMQSRDIRLIATIARGSSDHAATYLKYAIELTAKVPVASIGPSVSSIYGITLDLEDCASLSVSQSGGSPDIEQMTRSAKSGGALTIAITNIGDSPLAKASAHTIALQAGPERSVAATKTFVTSIVAGLLLLGFWQNDEKLLNALAQLPDLAAKATVLNWDALGTRMLQEDSLLVLGRGPSLAIASEVALKFKETCQIHAEAFSSAEVLHGPVAIVGSDYPILALAARDASEQSVVSVANRLAQEGADVFATSANADRCERLPVIASGHPLTDPLLLIISFYSFIEKFSRQRGLDPDVPRNLRKVTKTV